MGMLWYDISSYWNSIFSAFFRTFNWTLYHVDGNDSRFLFFGNERFFARQTESAVANECVFDPNDDSMNVPDNCVVFISKVFHRDIGTPVLERDQESVFDSQFRGWFAAVLVKCVEGCLEDFQHLVKGLSFDSEESFELSVADREGFLYVFG